MDNRFQRKILKFVLFVFMVAIVQLTASDLFHSTFASVALGLISVPFITILADQLSSYLID